MSRTHLEQVIATAISQGLLPPDAKLQADDTRPWPVVMLTALGAWLAAVPLIAIFFLAFGGLLEHGAGPFLVGLPLFAAAVALMRKTALPLFLEQLLVPALATGAAIVTWGMIEQLPQRLAGALLALLACATAVAIPRRWLQLLLGIAACVAAILALMPRHGFQNGFDYWCAIHVMLMVWVVLRLRSRSTVADALADGWSIALLAALALHAGMTFLLAAHLGAAGDNTWRTMAQPWDSVARAGSVMAALLAAAWLGHGWPSLRTTWAGLAATVLLGLCWLMPSLGGSLLILAVSVRLGNWRAGTAAGVAAAWIIGAFYYQAAYPLETKAAWLLAAGLLLAVLVALALRGEPIGSAATGATPSRGAALCLGLCALAVLAVANTGIWQKETLIAEGRPLFIELAPVDPRSLMQGDYMRLRFRLPDSADRLPSASARPRVVAVLDARGIATLQRFDTGAPLASNEVAIELTAFRSGWSVASDGWYFKEGEAARWARAKYGEFRVDGAGHALLVGMRGPALEPL